MKKPISTIQDCPYICIIYDYDGDGKVLAQCGVIYVDSTFYVDKAPKTWLRVHTDANGDYIKSKICGIKFRLVNEMRI